MTEPHSIAFLGGFMIAAVVIVILSFAISSFIYSFFFSSEQIPSNMAYRLDSLATRLNSVEKSDSFLFNLEGLRFFSLAKGFNQDIKGEVSIFAPECVDKNCLCFAKFANTVEKGAVKCKEVEFPIVSSEGNLFNVVLNKDYANNVNVVLKKDGCTNLKNEKVDCLMFTNLKPEKISVGLIYSGTVLKFS